MLGTWDESPK
jgi:hypothetical protein